MLSTIEVINKKVVKKARRTGLDFTLYSFSTLVCVCQSCELKYLTEVHNMIERSAEKLYVIQSHVTKFVCCAYKSFK